MAALYAEYGQNSSYTRSLSDPGGRNEVIMFKSCYPNSALEGNPDDPPDDSNPGLNVGYSKYVYNEIVKILQDTAGQALHRHHRSAAHRRQYASTPGPSTIGSSSTGSRTTPILSTMSPSSTSTTS